MAAVLAALTVFIPGAGADPQAPQDPSAQDAEGKPWSAGVTAVEKERANQLLAAGNELLVQNRYAEALERYEEAIKAWDHPAIRANMVVCFINLGRTLDAFESAELALRYGEGPYKKHEVYVETLNYAKLLDAQIVKLEIRCDEFGALVTLDGQTFLACPGKNRHRLLPGAHQIVARKRGYLTQTTDLVFQPGVTSQLDVRLVRLEDAAVTVRRWSAWKPWALVAGGVGLALAGGALQLKARSDMERADAARDRRCGTGCDPRTLPERIGQLESRAIVENRVAVGAAIAGATVAVAGLTLVYFNRARTILPDESGFNPRVAPTVIGGGAGIVLGGSF